MLEKDGVGISNAEIQSSKLEKTRPQQRVEIIAQCPENFPDTLKQYEKGTVIHQVKEGRLIDDQIPQALVKILLKIIDSEKITDGILRCWARRGVKKTKGLDQWHVDGETVFLYSNILPTEIIRDPNMEFRVGQNGRLLPDSAIPRTEDIWSPPDGAVVKMSGDVLHRRPHQAIGIEERFLLRIDPKSV